MLGVDWTVRLSALAVALAMPFALCGLSMGLGALFLDLKQRNPTAIVSGFGGTLTLALSLLYMMLSVLPFGLLFHGAVAHYYSAHTVRLVLPFLYLWLVALTLVTGLVPMILGRNSLKHREY